jgi:phage-related protein
MEIKNIDNICFANNILYFVAKVSFKYRITTTASVFVCIDVLVGFNVLTNEQKPYYSSASYIHSTTGKPLANNLGFRGCLFVDPTNDKIYLRTTNAMSIYNILSETSIRLVVSTYIVRAGAFIVDIKDLWIKNDVYYFLAADKFGKTFIDIFWGRKVNLNIETNALSRILIAKEDGNSFDSLSSNFFFETKLPFEFKNKFDFKQLDYRNSFVQNVAAKDNNNTLKQFSLKFENISTAQCKAMLLFLEKRSGYRRFLYDFPVLLKGKKCFICTEWSHSFKYDDCHDLNLLLIEDPNPNVYIPQEGDITGFYLVN